MSKLHFDNATLAEKLRTIGERDSRNFPDLLSYFPDNAVDEEERKKYSPNAELLHARLFEEVLKLSEDQQEAYKGAFMLFDDPEEDIRSIFNVLNICPSIAALLNEHLDVLEKEFPAPQHTASTVSQTPNTAPPLFSNPTLRYKMRELLGSEGDDERSQYQQEIMATYNVLSPAKRANLHGYLLSPQKTPPSFFLDEEIVETANRLSILLEKLSLKDLPSIPVLDVVVPISSKEKDSILLSRNAALAQKSKLSLFSESRAGSGERISYYSQGKLLFSLKIPLESPEEAERKATALTNYIATSLEKDEIEFLTLLKNTTLEAIVIKEFIPNDGASKKTVTEREYNAGLRALRVENDSKPLESFLSKDSRVRHYLAGYVKALKTVKALAAHKETTVEALALESHPSLKSVITGDNYQQNYSHALGELKYGNISNLAEFLATQPEARRIITDYAKTLPPVPSSLQSVRSIELSSEQRKGRSSLTFSPSFGVGLSDLADATVFPLRARSNAFHECQQPKKSTISGTPSSVVKTPSHHNHSLGGGKSLSVSSAANGRSATLIPTKKNINALSYISSKPSALSIHK